MMVFSRATEKADPRSGDARHCLPGTFILKDDGKFSQIQRKLTENGRKFCKNDGNWQKFLRFPRHIDTSVASHFTFSAALVLRHDAHDDASIFCSLGVQT